MQADELRAKRDQLLRNQAIPFRDGAGIRPGAGFAQGRVASTSDLVDLTAPALPPPRESERASDDLPGARPPLSNALDSFRVLVTRARVNRILRERDRGGR